MRNKSILMVEDNPDDQELIRMAMEESRIANELIILEDGVEALDYLFGTGPHTEGPLPKLPQLVLLDLKLPRLGGLEVLKQLRTNPRTALLPVVVMTTSNEEEDILSSYRLHCNSYIRKPVEFSQFAEAVRNLGLYWLVLNEVPEIK